MYEMASSRKSDVDLTGGNVTVDYILMRSDDEEEGGAALLDGTPTVFGVLQRQKASIEPMGGGVWKGSASYGADNGKAMDSSGTGGQGSSSQTLTPDGTPPAEPGDNDPLGYEFSFDTTGGTEHVTQSID